MRPHRKGAQMTGLSPPKECMWHVGNKTKEVVQKGTKFFLGGITGSGQSMESSLMG